MVPSPCPNTPRPYPIRLIFALASLIFGSAPAWATEPLTWEGLDAFARGAWEQGPGAAGQLREEGQLRAANHPRRGPSALWLQQQAAIGTAPSNGQDQLTLAVDLPLRLGLREAAAGAARAEFLWRQNLDARSHWLLQVHTAWLDGWIARENDAHLAEYELEVQGWLSPLEAALTDHLLSPLRLADLRGEFALLTEERLAANQAAIEAETELSRLLGRPVRVDPGARHLHQIATPSTNPWQGLISTADSAPEVRLATAGAVAAAAERRALAVETLPELSLGAAWVGGPNGREPLAYGGIRVPLSTGRFARKATLDSEIAAYQAEARWHSAEARAELEGESARYAALRERAERMEAAVIRPLRERQDQLEAAFRSGQVGAERLILARRDLHDAEHEQILLHARLLASEARAQVVRQQAQESQGGRP